MLIQANSQTERSAEDLDPDVKPPPLPPPPSTSAPTTQATGNDVEMLSVDEQRLHIKEEMMTDDYPPTASSTPVKSLDDPNHTLPPKDDSEATLKMEVDDDADDTTLKPAPIDQPPAADDASSKDINIDPRTYCKLGHFHLLLEEYPKGRLFIVNN